ncbi:NAD(P)-dependent oxidoreductase [Microbacterium sp. A93]|uniref:NAD(P)-dependent oxidoreductase n=1 Tax=Microbacterium sp. A93 TaxID=3450716 RepID=UPI003F42DBAE
MTPRIFIAIGDTDFARLYDADAQHRLAQLGEIVRPSTPTGNVRVPTTIGDDFDVLITSWSTEPFDPAVLNGSRLRLAVHSAGSVRRLFPIEALGNDLRIAQGGSDAMAEAVAEMAVTMTLALLRNLVLHDRRFQSSRSWITGGVGMLGQSIAAQRIGLVSLSRVGRHYARMVRGLGATAVRAYDPYATADEAAQMGVELCSLDELCATSDVLAIHAPSTPDTAQMIGAPQLALLRDDAIVINTARAEVTDEQAILTEVRSGRLRVGLDVYSSEPLPADSDFFGRENALLTPHVAGGTVQARFGQGHAVIDEIERFLTDGTLHAEVTSANYERLG